MFKIKRLKDCEISEAVEAWNIGFEGYYFDLTMTTEKFMARMASEGLSDELSVVAFWNDKPVGLIVNGIREFQGELIGWNGGTAVDKDYRSKGIGRRMLEATLDILEENNVKVSTLEAISENKGAIALYQSLGYDIIDHLECLEKKEGHTPVVRSNGFQVKSVSLEEVGNLPFYQGKNPWQTHWQSVIDGEALIAEDTFGNALGYAYFRKIFSEEGMHTGTTLYQCEADRSRSDQKEIIQSLLAEAFHPSSDHIRHYVPNLPKLSSSTTHGVLKEMGFEPVVHLVYMKQILS
ncbi:GNAT family N-acetyltransferase [Robertmurraya korlensis]|uniref:GNAT family N-acetyltransferase n=1 Tax=Robertmurraya korlensis TaxID=519977 RepID=UPI00203B1770|nr:GNAT family N-acetyltransferase [Robertmurraya korlensis]MCM3601383.1 GNAT family N-acetyltransferase [Robertmurraya korlensis]